MAILNGSTNLGTVVRKNQFSVTISISPSANLTITSITCSPQGATSLSGISIVTTLSSVRISGSYLSLSYIDRAKYITKGSSDKLETPKEVVGAIWGTNSLLPPNQEVISFSQDTTPNKIQNYNIRVRERNANNITFTTNFTVFHTILNDWTSGTEALKAYYGT